MKRKTNLFYTSGPDSKFITFSNYTESLTGNFLSTDTKLFPDKFLCLKIYNINNITKSEFIKYLVRYYENKLAALRDNCILIDELSEQNILPLSYLLEAILKVCTYNEGKYTFDTTKLNSNGIIENSFTSFTESNGYPNEIKNFITYIGDITEQDYNGTYTDTICSINSNNYYIGTIYNNRDYIHNSEEVKSYTEDVNLNILHGWETQDIYFEDYKNTLPLYDVKDTVSGTYYYNSYLLKISYEQLTNPNDPIEFNIIIPLFSFVNINTKTNNTLLNSDNKEILLSNISSENGKLCARYNVPLGIWINTNNNDETESFITLKKDTEMNVYPSWSLLISSQFKPFPYSLDNKFNNESQNGIMYAYPTFAETLSKINDVLDKFSKMNTQILELSNRIAALEKVSEEKSTVINISKLDSKIIQLTSSFKNEMNEFKQQLYGYIDNITWSNKYKNNN